MISATTNEIEFQYIVLETGLECRLMPRVKETMLAINIKFSRYLPNFLMMSVHSSLVICIFSAMFFINFLQSNAANTRSFVVEAKPQRKAVAVIGFVMH